MKTGEKEFKLLSGSIFKEDEKNSEDNDDTINLKMEMDKLWLFSLEVYDIYNDQSSDLII